jgi:hypothetical protein
MNIEQAVYDAVESAITNYPGYSTAWDKTIFYVEDFDLDIPSGSKHKGNCPFVAFRGGTSDDFTQEAGDLFNGTVEFEITLYLSSPLVMGKASWEPMHIFTGDIERAIDSIDTAGFKMKPTTSKENPTSGKGLITRLLTVSVDASECRTPNTPPVNTVSPVVTPDPPTEGDLLTTTDGTWTFTAPVVYTYQWYQTAGLIIGATSATYQTIVGDAGDVFYCKVTATDLYGPTTQDSNSVTAASSCIYPSLVTPNAVFNDFDFDVLSTPTGYETTADYSDPVTPTSTYYVASATGSDLNPGTEISPFATIKKAWDLLDTDMEDGTIYANGEFFHGEVAQDDGRTPDNNTEFAIIGWSGRAELINGYKPSDLTWSVVGSGAYDTTLTEAATHNVIDKTNLDSFSMPTPLRAGSSVADVQSLGGWYLTGTTLTIKLFDSRAPDSDTYVLADLTTSPDEIINFRSSELYLKDIDVWGFTWSNATISSVTNMPTYIIDSSTFGYTNAADDALALAGQYTAGACVRSVTCAYPGADGFNYNLVGDFLEEDCTSYNAGWLGILDAANQASTAHNDAIIIRVGGEYTLSGGQNIADTTDTYTWQIGSRIHSSRSTGPSRSVDFGIYIDAFGWVTDCDFSGSTSVGNFHADTLGVVNRSSNVGNNTETGAGTIQFYAQEITLCASATYRGVYDVLRTLPKFAAGSKLLRAAYTGEAADIRRISDSANDDIGYVDGDYDTASHDTFIGGSSATTITNYDHIGSNDADSLGITDEPVKSDTGTDTYDNTNDSMVSPVLMTSGTAFSGMCILNTSNSGDAFQRFIGHIDSGSTKQWGANVTLGTIEFLKWTGGAQGKAKYTANFYDSINHLLAWNYNSTDGYRLWMDGLELADTQNTSGLVDQLGSGLEIGSRQGGISNFDGIIDIPMFFDGAELTAYDISSSVAWCQEVGLLA